MVIYVSCIEVGGVLGLPQTPLALLLFLPGQFDDVYVKLQIMHDFYRWGPPKAALFTSLLVCMAVPIVKADARLAPCIPSFIQCQSSHNSRVASQANSTP